jgi:hypothetical protein
MARGSASYHLAAASLGALFVVVFGLLFAAVAPGEWFVRFQLAVIPEPEGPQVIVVQTRSAMLDRPFVAEWHAKVDRLEADGRTEICNGGGLSTYQSPATAFRAPIHQWVGSPACDLQSGETYQVTASWRFRLLGLIPQVTVASSAPFVAR